MAVLGEYMCWRTGYIEGVGVDIVLGYGEVWVYDYVVRVCCKCGRLCMGCDRSAFEGK